MGKTLRKYVIREILGAFLAGLVAFSFILLIARILDLVDLILARGVPATEVIRLFAYILPSFLEITTPMAVLLAVVVAFGRLSSDGELLAMRSAGVSLYQLVRPALYVGALLGLVTLFLAAYARPWASRQVSETIYEIAKTRATAALRPRVFNAFSDGMVIYVDSIDAERGRLAGILLSDERDDDTRTTVLSRTGSVVANADAKSVYLRLADGTSVTSHTGEDSYDVTAFASLEVNLDLDSAGIAGSPLEDLSPEELYPAELLSARSRLVAAGEPALAESLEIQRKLALAGATVLLALLGVPLGLQPSRAVRARGMALSLAVILAYYVALTAAVALARRELLEPATAMWLPNVALAIAGLVLLRRAASGRPNLRWPAWASWGSLA